MAEQSYNTGGAGWPFRSRRCLPRFAVLCERHERMCGLRWNWWRKNWIQGFSLAHYEWLYGRSRAVWNARKYLIMWATLIILHVSAIPTKSPCSPTWHRFPIVFVRLYIWFHFVLLRIRNERKETFSHQNLVFSRSFYSNRVPILGCKIARGKEWIIHKWHKIVFPYHCVAVGWQILS